jgi:CRP-like cAMP-binding protein
MARALDSESVCSYQSNGGLLDGPIFYRPDETGEVLFLLKKGAVQIYRMSPEGRKLIIANLLPYSFFG